MVYGLATNKRWTDDGWTTNVAESDWHNDRAGFGTLNYQRFSKSIFEMIDTHTDTMDVEEYCALLDQLLERLGVAHLKSEARAHYGSVAALRGDMCRTIKQSLRRRQQKERGWHMKRL